jgi:hypothetical protein
LIELCNYNVLGRILYYVPYLSPIHPGRVISTFAFLSAIVESLNGWGASYTANQSLPESQQAIGHTLLKTGLVIQLAVVACFLLLAGIFHRRCVKAGVAGPNLRSALLTLYCSSALITVRTIYRVVEYWSLADALHFQPGFDPMTLSPLIRYEWFFYVFEATLMLCNNILLNVRHPRKYLPKSTKTYLAKDGVTELTGPGYKDKRPFLLTVIDPFDLGGLLKGKKEEDRFWDHDGIQPATNSSSVRKDSSPAGQTEEV